MRRFPGLVLAALAIAAAAAAQPPPSRDAKQAPAGAPIVLEGCLSGTALKEVAVVSPAGSRDPAVPMYRLTGSKAVKQAIRDRNGRFVKVAGQLRGAKSPSAGRSARVGGARITVGAGPAAAPNAPRVPETPLFEVESIETVESGDGNCR